MIVTINLDEPGTYDDAPVTIQLGIVHPSTQTGMPDLLIQHNGAAYSVEEMRDHLQELESIRDKYREIMSALGRAT